MTQDDGGEPGPRRVPRRALLRGAGVVAASATVGAVAATWVDQEPDPGSAGGTSTFVLGGSSDPSAARFDRWDALVQALDDAPPGDKWIVVEGEVSAPAGEWDLRGAGFRGHGSTGVGLSPQGHPDVLRFADGCRITNVSRHLASDGILLWSDSSRSVLVVDDERSYYFENDAWVTSTDAAFFEVTATNGTLVLFSFRTGSGLVLASTMERPGRDRPSIDHTGSATLIVAMASGNNLFDDDTVAGNGVVIAAISSAAGIGYPGTPRSGFTHRGVTSVTPLIFSVAENIRVEVARREDWPERPRDVAHALDLLAARIAALEG